MKFTTLLPVLFITVLLTSCNDKSNQVTDKKDYTTFLELTQNETIELATSEINFWKKKLTTSPDQFSYLGKLSSNYSILFEQTGNIEYLHKSEKLLVQLNEVFNYSSTGSIRSLARNYITQHRFKEALVLANKALSIGDGMHETQSLLFDVQMELGNYVEAEKALSKIKNFKDFDYLIRLSKWNDHKGDLTSAIKMMEKAKDIAVFNDNKTLKIWSYSNLGDMNGHAGNIDKAYQYYLQTLKMDPNNSYALKGIAWIAFSHEKNTDEAKRIINKIAKNHNSPDFFLLKSEIAEFENNTKEKEANLNSYFAMLQQNNYGVMYNKYNALIYADSKKNASKALEIAKQEVQNRPTPDSYDLLAWAYFNAGQTQKALEITNKFVAQKSFEPELNYHVATIYKATNLNHKIKPIKSDLEASLFELGPNMIAKIQSL